MKRPVLLGLAVLLTIVTLIPQPASASYEGMQREASYQQSVLGVTHTIWAKASVSSRKFGCGFAWTNSCLNFRDATFSSMGWYGYFEKGAVTKARVKGTTRAGTWGTSITGVSVSATGPAVDLTSTANRSCYRSDWFESNSGMNVVNLVSQPGVDICKVVTPVFFGQGGQQYITNAKAKSDGAVQTWGTTWYTVAVEAVRDY